MEGGEEVVVRWRTRKCVTEEQWVVLLNLASLHVGANVSGDGLTGGRNVLADEAMENSHVCKVLYSHCAVPDRHEGAAEGEKDL